MVKQETPQGSSEYKTPFSSGCVAELEGLYLMGGDVGFPVAKLNPGTTIDLSDPFLPWNLNVGYFTQKPISGVIYKFDDGKDFIVEEPPYPLFKYTCDRFVERAYEYIKPGFHTIRATPFAIPESRCKCDTLVVPVYVAQSITIVWKAPSTVTGCEIHPFTVSNIGTSPVSLRGPHIYQFGQHILADGYPPLAHGKTTIWNMEFTVPAGNINFVTTFRSNGDHSFTWQSLENPDGTPFILQPGQSLHLEFVKPVADRERRHETGTGSSDAPVPHGHPPLGPP